MPITNHNAQNNSIYQMVLNRLTFLADTTNNETLVSGFIFEVMWELEPCFKIRAKTSPPADSNVGDEANYSVVQKSIIADLVSVYILVMQAASLSSGVIANGTTFLTMAKAGSVEVQYSQFDVTKSATLALNGASLITLYKSQASRKGVSIGCIIDITDAAGLMVQEYAQTQVQSFRTFQSSGIDSNGSRSNVAERFINTQCDGCGS